MTGKVIKTGDVLTYLVEYDEDSWNAFTPEQQENCWNTWIKKCAPMGCAVVSLKLHPDDLFPRGEHETPYIVGHRRIEQEAKDAPKHYVAAGKQVLLNGAHFADAKDYEAAIEIVGALNR